MFLEQRKKKEAEAAANGVTTKVATTGSKAQKVKSSRMAFSGQYGVSALEVTKVVAVGRLLSVGCCRSGSGLHMNRREDWRGIKVAAARKNRRFKQCLMPQQSQHVA